jgi:serine/threonine protein kinase
MDDPAAAERLRTRLGARAEPAPEPAARDAAVIAERPAAAHARVGPYTLEGAAPSPGSVVRARTADGEPVALRLLGRTGSGADSAWLELRQAAARAARVEDRNLVPGLHADEADGWRYLTLAWCEGGSLADRLAGGRVPSADETIRIVVRAARGLDALHRADVVHGAIRAGSILFGADGRALLVPLATGSERSAAPEVHAGAAPSPASDIYDLASLAQSCLARTDAVSGDLDWAVATALATEPAQRPQTAAMFGQMLRMAGRAAPTG